MASNGIQTARAARARQHLDENAPPTSRALKSSTLPTSTTTAKTNLSQAPKETSASNIPVMKRTYSSSTATTRSKVVDNGAVTTTLGGGSTIGTKRSALGEVTNAGKKKAVLGEKDDIGKKEVLRQPLSRANTTTTTTTLPVNTTIARRTRSSIPPSLVPPTNSIQEKTLPTKRKTAGTTTTSTLVGALSGPSKIPTSARSRSTTASTVASEAKLASRRLNKLVPPPPTDKDSENETSGPARKRRKTSTPPLETAESEEEEEEVDIHDEALYDEDGKEVVLSSGGRGTTLQSPKRVPKDYGWTDLDLEDEGDPNMVSEYVIDAFNYMIEIEKTTMPSPDYMDKQAELQWKMRTILMDWIIEVHSKFRLLPETLFIATNLIDRFLSLRVVSLVKVQLVGLTALFVAAKYEEVICPSITHFLHMTDGGYGVEEILKAERYLLSTLDFDLSYPNPLHFLRRVSKADGYDIQTRTVAKYLIEISCLEEKLLAFTPSMLAAAGTWLARLCLDRGEWGPNLVHYSTYSQEELLPCAQIMLNFILDPKHSVTTVFYKKYASKKHMKSSIYVQAWADERWPKETREGPNRGRELEIEASYLG